MNAVIHNRSLFLIVRTVWNLGSGFYTDPKFILSFNMKFNEVGEKL